MSTQYVIVSLLEHKYWSYDSKRFRSSLYYAEKFDSLEEAESRAEHLLNSEYFSDSLVIDKIYSN